MSEEEDTLLLTLTKVDVAVLMLALTIVVQMDPDPLVVDSARELVKKIHDSMLVQKGLEGELYNG